jgi:hypothetical protein
MVSLKNLEAFKRVKGTGTFIGQEKFDQKSLQIGSEGSPKV